MENEQKALQQGSKIITVRQMLSFKSTSLPSYNPPAGKVGLEGNPREIKVEGYECNVAEETSVKEVFEDILRSFGKIDSVISSAGVHPHVFFPVCD